MSTVNLIPVVSKQEFKKVRMGSVVGFTGEAILHPGSRFPDWEEGREGCILWGGIWISPFLLIFSESIHVTNLHILLSCASLWPCRHRFTQDAWSRPPGPEFLPRKNNFTHQALGAVFASQGWPFCLSYWAQSLPSPLQPCCHLPWFCFRATQPRAAGVTWPASALRVHPSVRTSGKKSKELEIFRGEGMLGDPSTSLLSFRRRN